MRKSVLDFVPIQQLLDGCENATSNQEVRDLDRFDAPGTTPVIAALRPLASLQTINLMFCHLDAGPDQVDTARRSPEFMIGLLKLFLDEKVIGFHLVTLANRGPKTWGMDLICR